MLYSGKQVVVTGGAGFIGNNMVRELMKAGANVTVIDLPGADFSPLPVGIRIIRCDIMNFESLPIEIRSADYIFHLAARTDINGRSLEDYRVNYEGTKNILEAAADNKQLRRFVLFSTQLVVGLFNETRFIGPEEEYRTKTAYGQSKIEAEIITKKICTQKGIPYVILRPTSVYGPYGRAPYRDFFLTLQRHRYMHAGRANNLVSMAYVKNVVDIALFIGDEERACGQIFYGTDFHPYTMREFSDSAAHLLGFEIPTIPLIVMWSAAYFLGIFKAIGINVPLYPFRLHNILDNYCYDISNAVKLGFFPRYSLRDGMQETIEWYLENDQSFVRE
jgi:GlcNAc-P-P-Und epimerase